MENAALKGRKPAALRYVSPPVDMTDAEFRDRLDTLQDPTPKDPIEALHELIEAVAEDAKHRVGFIDEAFEKMRHEDAHLTVPETAGLLFHNLGDWETYATPCRDLKLLNLLRAVDTLSKRRRIERSALFTFCNRVERCGERAPDGRA
jgi:hypothetical protein